MKLHTHTHMFLTNIFSPMHFSYSHLYILIKQKLFVCFYDDEMKMKKMVFDVFSSVLNGIIDFLTIHIYLHFVGKHFNGMKNIGIVMAWLLCWRGNDNTDLKKTLILVCFGFLFYSLNMMD